MRLRSLLAYACFSIAVLMIGTATAAPQVTKFTNPSDPAATVPAFKYDSAFSDYKPFREQKASQWRQVNKEVADNPGMGSMKDMSGKAMRGMDSGKERTDGHDIGPMKDMPDHGMPGMDSEAANESMRKDEETMAKVEPQPTSSRAANAETGAITGTGIVRVIDKANGKVKLSHEPIAELGWPKMSMFFRLKDNSLADSVNEGDKVEFSLEKSTSGYVISGWHRTAAGHDMKKRK